MSLTLPHWPILMGIICIFLLGWLQREVKQKGGKTQQGVTDVQGDGSRRRGAVANFMPCIFLSCMANSVRASTMKCTPCDPPHFSSHLVWASSGGAWTIWGGLANPYYGLLSYRANSHLIKNQGGDSSGSSIWVRYPWLPLRCKWLPTPSTSAPGPALFEIQYFDREQ